MPESMSIGEAANAIGISADTLRRWNRAGKIQSYRTDRGHRRIPGSE
ncbi:MAG: helix-turn-helix domain-containing protein [Solirubrobacteraceae bacterium]